MWTDVSNRASSFVERINKHPVLRFPVWMVGTVGAVAIAIGVIVTIKSAIDMVLLPAIKEEDILLLVEGIGILAVGSVVTVLVIERIRRRLIGWAGLGLLVYAIAVLISAIARVDASDIVGGILIGATGVLMYLYNFFYNRVIRIRMVLYNFFHNKGGK